MFLRKINCPRFTNYIGKLYVMQGRGKAGKVYISIHRKLKWVGHLHTRLSREDAEESGVERESNSTLKGLLVSRTQHEGGNR